MTSGGKTHQALYRKYRSKSLDEILGQNHITGLLKNALKKGKISHAYLLTGPRGTGKTSIARILAHEINQLPYTDDSSHLDIIEIDAASNNGIEDVRALREKAQIAPVSAKYKVYIIDEVHMLSKPAFNALLKTLEEPPAHVIFILATTDADKLPSTILSRVQQYYFHPISTAVIAQHLQKIAKSEGFKVDQDATQLIAELSGGGFRDSISLLDQLSSLADDKTPLTKEQVSASVGLISDQPIKKILSAYLEHDYQAIMQILNDLENSGADPLIITKQLLTNLRQLAPERPQYLGLIHELIEVTKHAHPDLRLLTALTSPLLQAKTTSNGQQQSQMMVEDNNHRSYQPDNQTVADSLPAKRASTPKPITSDQTQTESKSPKVKPNTTNKKPVLTTTSTKTTFDWTSIIDGVKQQSIGLSGLLSMCDQEYDGKSLVLFAGKPFNKKRLEDSKSLSLINQIIRQQLNEDVEIIIKSGKKPPANKKIAEVTAIMGGGEEVLLEEIS